MDNLKKGKKVYLTALLLAFVLCLSVGAVLAANNNSNVVFNASATIVGATTNNSSGAAVNAVAEYTYGETYTIGGQEYKLGSASMDYKTALGLADVYSATRADDYNVTLKSFTYFDGSD